MHSFVSLRKRKKKTEFQSLTCVRKLPQWQLQAEDRFAQPGKVLNRVPALMRDKVPGIRQVELAWWPRESAELRRCYFVSNVSKDSVVQLDDRRRVLRRKTCSSPLLAVSVNSWTELTTQSGLYELH